MQYIHANRICKLIVIMAVELFFSDLKSFEIEAKYKLNLKC